MLRKWKTKECVMCKQKFEAGNYYTKYCPECARFYSDMCLIHSHLIRKLSTMRKLFPQEFDNVMEQMEKEEGTNFASEILEDIDRYDAKRMKQ